MLDEDSHLEIIATYFNSTKDSDNKYASPLYGDFNNFPKTLLFALGSEVLMDDSILLAKHMKEQGVDITFNLRHNMMHAYVIMPYYKEAKNDLKKTIELIQNNFQ